MKTAYEENLRMDLRRVRSQQLTNAIWQVLRDFIPYDCEKKAFDALYKLLHEQGAEIVTDHQRTELGLPPRGPDGWTPQELIAMEARRLELLTKPLIIPSIIKE